MAITNADGSIILTTKVDTGGMKRGVSALVKEQRAELQKLEKEYARLVLTNKQNTKEGEELKKQIENVVESLEKSEGAMKDFGEESQKSGKTAKTAFLDVGSSLKQLAVVAIAAVVASIAKATQEIIQFSKEASNVATQAEASVKRLTSIYGSASKAVGDFIDQNALALGMSRAAASSFASVYGNLFSVWADQQTNAKLTNAYLQATAVVASQTGRTVEDVQERFRSGLLGNTEAIEDLGIFVNIKTIEITDAFQRMANGKSWQQLDAYTQQQIRTMAILEQATQKYGNQVVKTSALSRSRFSAAYQDFQATWGQVVNVVLVPVMNALTKVLILGTTVLQTLFSISASTIKQGDAIQGATENQKELTEAVEGTAAAQKKALAGFDEINTLSEEGSGGGVSVPSIPTQPIDFQFNLETNAEEFLSELEPLKKKIQDILLPLKESFDNLRESVTKAWSGIYETVLKPFGDWFINEFSPSYIQGIVTEVDKLAKSFDLLGENIDTVKTDATGVFDTIGELINLATLEVLGFVNTVISSFVGAYKQASTILAFIGDEFVILIGALWINFEYMYAGLINAIISIVVIVQQVITAIIKAIEAAFALFEGILTGNFDHFKQAIKEFGIAVGNTFIGIFNLVLNAIYFVLSPWLAIVYAVIDTLLNIVEKAARIAGKNWDLTFSTRNIPAPPQIPYLAQGAVVPPNREFLAVLGDNKKENEIVSPVSTMKEAFAEVLAQANIGGNFNGRIEIPVIIDGREITRVVRDNESKLGTQTVFGGFANAY